MAADARAYESFDDKELCTLIRRNSRDIIEKAFKELYRRYNAKVRGYCYYMVNRRPEAEDIFQETFVRFYQALEGGTQVDNVNAYLLRIARNLCLNYRRDFVRHDSLEGLQDTLRISAHKRAFEQEELDELIKRAAYMLDIEYREAFVLREYEDLSYEEISQIMRISVSNAKVRVLRAKQRIRELLAPYIREFAIDYQYNLEDS